MVQVVGAVATALGLTVRFLLWVLSLIPYAAGPVVLFYGVWQIYRPAAWIAIGLFLTVYTFRDGRSKTERRSK